MIIHCTINSKNEIKPKNGDKVNYTNPQGVFWGERTIKDVFIGTDPNQFFYGQTRYYIDPTDTPWYCVGEDCLTLIKKESEQR
jgi:hypothetical protein